MSKPGKPLKEKLGWFDSSSLFNVAPSELAETNHAAAAAGRVKPWRDRRWFGCCLRGEAAVDRAGWPAGCCASIFSPSAQIQATRLSVFLTCQQVLEIKLFRV